MKFRSDKFGNNLSVLGYGCMRFPTKLGKIDMEETEKLVLKAIDNGINYFDTAYIYPGSEAALGEILEKNNLISKVNIATKLPHYLIKNKETLDKLFNEQLKRLKTDHIDYYFLHMLTDIGAFKRMEELGLKEWIKDKKLSGEIKQIGFSYHGNSDMFIELIDSYNWDFTMIQYNYMDENSQAGKRGLKYASSKGIPVMIMEPLRGGRLVSKLSSETLKLFENHSKKYSPAAWAFKWLFNQSEVTVVLSGMSNMDVLEENINIASNSFIGELDEDDLTMLNRVSDSINSKMKVGCTGCGYCMPCPMGVDIPGTFSAYNRKYSEGVFAALKEHVMCTALRKTPTSASNCIGCGKCEQHCPQNINIREQLKSAENELEGIPYRLVKKFAPHFVKF